MKVLLVISGLVLCVQSQGPIQDLYQLPGTLQLASRANLNNVEKSPKLPPLRTIRKSEINLIPPATSYGVPLLYQALPSASLSAAFETTSAENDTTLETTPKVPVYGDYSPSEEITVNRNVYFYKPPNDFVIIPTRKPVKLRQPQKNYNIIFIKAPNVPVPPPVVQFVPQNEDKTLVYVLVKKPDEQPEVLVPTPPSTEASKPEVYFVKYGTQKENIENSEKSYGISQYGKGYNYNPPVNTESNSSISKGDETDSDKGDETDSDKGHETDSDKDEHSKENKRIERQNGKLPFISKQEKLYRLTRSHSTKNEIARRLLDFSTYSSPLIQRSRVYE